MNLGDFGEQRVGMVFVSTLWCLPELFGVCQCCRVWQFYLMYCNGVWYMFCGRVMPIVAVPCVMTLCSIWQSLGMCT